MSERPRAKNGRPQAEVYGDPLTTTFWEAAIRHELLIQRCAACGHYQSYPRPFCLNCEGEDVGWVRAAGTGTVYSVTTVHLKVSEEFGPPYQVAVVELDEGPRLLTNIVGTPCQIDDIVRVAWREREKAPPLPVFRRI